MKRKTITRLAQGLSLLLFLFLLWRMVWPLPELFLPADIFLHLDPSVALSIPLAAREILPGLWPGLLLLLLAFPAGRFFCGMICPMGATLDLARFLLAKILGPARSKRASGSDPESVPSGGKLFPRTDFRQAKYLILAAVLGAALLGVNLVFWVSPLPLITRLYALALHPLALLAGHGLLPAGQAVLAPLDLPELAYAHIELRRFDSLPFLVFFFGFLFGLERLKPRFWCRYCCPAGALLALCSLRPLWRRRVASCLHCGRCSRQCPMEAIAPAGFPSRSRECLVCRECLDVCPAKGTFFSCKETGRLEREGAAAREGAAGLKGTFGALAPVQGALAEGRALPSRRAFLGAAGSGVVLAALEMSGAHSLLGGEVQGLLWPAACIRPPGALPEPDFLIRCLRCGQCMKACPGNALQPAWLEAGPEGMFSPLLLPRRGPCEPDCHVCGALCPTRAITPLPPEEKCWAKVGTAVVDPGLCLAWAQGRRCVVCEEVCPYGAVATLQDARSRFGPLPVPVVKPERCFGCGYCEYYCPVRIPAITVKPLGALRLSGSGYAEAGRAAGLRLLPAEKIRAPAPDDPPEGALPPGFSPL
ncbi:MAG: 4Fe-4S binding protein [Deltaproteobacteria bacterium]|jgi:MauM/NapG family ferredoxin protein|nr:4Fe-4S binding protein [Deltaproteobacteria bacterium]